MKLRLIGKKQILGLVEDDSVTTVSVEENTRVTASGDTRTTPNGDTRVAKSFS